MPPAAPAEPERLRLDKWLFHARLAKSRGIAAEMIETGRLRVNAQPVGKPAHAIRPGDTLTFVQGGRVRVLRILACGTRRGPATEAAQLYLDLDEPVSAGQVTGA